MKEIDRLEDLTPDPENANNGTKRGLDALHKSLERFGAGRSILVDKNGVILAGNKTHEAAVDMGLDVVVVRTSGHELVVVQRTDLDVDADPARAKGLAIADNRAGELGLAWDAAELARAAEQGAPVQSFFFPEELSRLTAAVGAQMQASIDAARSIEPPQAGSTTIDTERFGGDSPAREPGDDGEETEEQAPERRPVGNPVVSYNIIFDDEVQQRRWFEWLRALKVKYPEHPTIGSRIDEELRLLGIEAK